jgi:flagellar hook-length control protein FliK
MSNLNLVNLLTNREIKIKNKHSIKNNENFIKKLLEYLEPKKAVNLLKDLNLSKEEIKGLIATLPENKQKLYSILFNKSDKNLIKKTTDNLEKELNKKLYNNLTPNKKIYLKKTEQSSNSILQYIINLKPDNNLNNKKHINNIADILINTERKSNPEIKSEITKIKKYIFNSLKKEIKTFYPEAENIKSFDQLLSFADKNNIDIKKFILNKNFKSKTAEMLSIQNPSDKKLKHSKKKSEILQSLLNNKKKTTNTKIKNETENKEINLINMQHTQMRHKIVETKESIKHFSNNLKEAIENYKPPISKISIELHPKELGKVDITIIHRGDNLQININSNKQAINFFHNNQTELKNTLMNIGYSGIDMNFNSNQNRENQSKKNYKQYFFNKNNENYDELTIEIPYIYA